MFSDCPVMMIDSSANGNVSGSDSRIVTGCSHDSNCAARIRYMNTSDSPKAIRKFCAARPSSRDRPANRVLYPGPMLRGRPSSSSDPSDRSVRRPAGARVDRHLALRFRRLISDGAVPDALRARLTSGTLPPCRTARSLADRGRRVARVLRGADVHLVLLAAFLVGRDLLAADEHRSASAASDTLTPRSADFSGRPARPARACRRSSTCRRRPRRAPSSPRRQSPPRTSRAS